MFEFIDVFHMTSVSTTKLLLNNLDKQILSWPINSRDSRRKCLYFSLVIIMNSYHFWLNFNQEMSYKDKRKPYHTPRNSNAQRLKGMHSLPDQFVCGVSGNENSRIRLWIRDVHEIYDNRPGKTTFKKTIKNFLRKTFSIMVRFLPLMMFFFLKFKYNVKQFSTHT